MTVPPSYQQPPGSPDHRVPSDEDRQHAAQLIRSAHQRGEVSEKDLTTLDRRIDMAASVEEIQEIVALPALNIRDRHISDAQVALPLPPASPVIKCVISDAKFNQPAAIPASMEWSSIFGDITYDFRQCQFTTPVVTIRLDMICADMTVRVPAGVVVADESTSILSDVKTKGVVPGTGHPIVLRFEGRKIMSDLTVIGPDHTPLYEKIVGA